MIEIDRIIFGTTTVWFQIGDRMFDGRRKEFVARYDRVVNIINNFIFAHAEPTSWEVQQEAHIRMSKLLRSACEDLPDDSQSYHDYILSLKQAGIKGR